MYGKSTKRKWHCKLPHNINNTEVEDKPGIVSVDMLLSPSPGLVAQMTGRLTTKQYKYATVFVDQCTRYTYLHLQMTQHVTETLEGKMEFERQAALIGVTIKHYHVDNGVFWAHAWIMAC